MKLSEIYFQDVILRYDNPSSDMIIAYGKICHLEGVLSEAKSNSRKRQLKKLLERIAQENRLQYQ